MAASARIGRMTTRAELAALIAGVAIIFGACSSAATTAPSAPAASGKVIKLGVLAPLTGDSAADGQEMVRGAQLAVDELNAAGGLNGYTFEVVQGDTQNQQADAVSSAAQRLLSDQEVHAILTGYASGTNFEINLMAQANVPYLVAANSAQTQAIVAKDPSKYPTVWSLTPSYDAYGTAMPGFINDLASSGKLTIRNKKVYIVTSDNPYSSTISDGLTKAFSSAGWSVVGEDKVPYGAIKDWGAIIAKIQAQDPQLVVNTDYLPANDASFMLQFLAKPTNSLVFIQYGPSVPEFITLTKTKSTGVLYNLLGGPIPGNKRADDIKAKFKAKFGVDTGTYGVQLYEEVQLYVAALKSVGDPANHTAIGAAIGAMSTDTASGPLAFDPATHLAVQGDAGIPLQWFQIQDGNRVEIAPSQYATGQFQLPPWMK